MPLAEAAAQSDVIYLAQPIEQILETLDVIDGAVRPGTLITDAGSTKQAIVERAGQTIKRGRFVGGHPMAGKEARGAAEAEAIVSVPALCAHGMMRNLNAGSANRRAAGEARCGGT